MIPLPTNSSLSAFFSARQDVGGGNLVLKFCPTRESGYVTIIVVVILGLLALFAARQATVSTVNSLRTVTVAQSSVMSVYAAEVVLREALEVRPFGATNWVDGTSVDQGTDGRSYAASYCVQSTSDADQFKVFARAEQGQFKAVVSQHVNVRDGKPYLVPGTWTDTELPTSCDD